MIIGRRPRENEWSYSKELRSAVVEFESISDDQEDGSEHQPTSGDLEKNVQCSKRWQFNQATGSGKDQPRHQNEHLQVDEIRWSNLSRQGRRGLIEKAVVDSVEEQRVDEDEKK